MTCYSTQQKEAILWEGWIHKIVIDFVGVSDCDLPTKRAVADRKLIRRKTVTGENQHFDGISRWMEDQLKVLLPFIGWYLESGKDLILQGWARGGSTKYLITHSELYCLLLVLWEKKSGVDDGHHQLRKDDYWKYQTNCVLVETFQWTVLEPTVFTLNHNHKCMKPFHIIMEKRETKQE